MRYIIALLLCLSYLLNVQSQTLKIVAIPFVKQGDDKSDLLENNVTLRAFESIIQEVFLTEERFSLVDYEELLNEMAKKGIVLPRDADTADDLLVRYADADIYIRFDINKTRNSQGYALRNFLKAYWTHTGEVIGSTTLDSGFRNYQDDYLLLKKSTMNTDMDGVKKLEKFIQIMKEMQINSQSVSILFTNKNTDLNFFTQLDNDKEIFKHILDAVKTTSANHQADADLGDTVLNLPKVSIPNRANNGDRLTPQDYAYELFRRLQGVKTKEGSNSIRFKYGVSGNNLNFSIL